MTKNALLYICREREREREREKRNFPLIMITEIITRHKGHENKCASCEGFTRQEFHQLRAKNRVWKRNHESYVLRLGNHE